jgi:cytidine deaminase
MSSPFASRALAASDPTWDPLIAAAIRTRKQAHAPYSRYAVGAAFLCGDGSIVEGCNVENASFGGTICAERNAIWHAIATGRRSFVAGVVVTRGPEPGAPCGLCRQVMVEFATELPLLLLAEETDVREVVWLSDLLPKAFGAAALRA